MYASAFEETCEVAKVLILWMVFMVLAGGELQGLVGLLCGAYTLEAQLTRGLRGRFSSRSSSSKSSRGSSSSSSSSKAVAVVAVAVAVAVAVVVAVVVVVTTRRRSSSSSSSSSSDVM